MVRLVKFFMFLFIAAGCSCGQQQEANKSDSDLTVVVSYYTKPGDKIYHNGKWWYVTDVSANTTHAMRKFAKIEPMDKEPPKRPEAFQE